MSNPTEDSSAYTDGVVPASMIFGAIEVIIGKKKKAEFLTEFDKRGLSVSLSAEVKEFVIGYLRDLDDKSQPEFLRRVIDKDRCDC